jgi:lysophospholipase L1-like esterase
MRSILIRLCAVVAAAFIGLGAAEIFLRIINYHYSPLRIEVQHKNDWREFHALEDPSFVSDSYLIWRPKAGAAIFNSQGYRGPELRMEKEPRTLRVFAIGDSNTLGWGETNGPNWPLYLGELLDRVDHRFVMVNAGVWGYSSFQGVRWYEGVVRYQPDLVLVSFGANDAHQVTISDADFVKLGGRKYSLYLGLLLNRLRIGQLLLASSDKLFLKEKERLVPRVSLAEYKANLEEIIRISKRRNIQVVLLTRIFSGQSNDPRWWKTYAPKYNEAVMEISRSTGIYSIDAYSRFKDNPGLYADEAHFTGDGHKAMAQFVFDNLEPVLQQFR